MFFGTPVNIARYDLQRFPIFEHITETQLSFFWRPEEICLSNDCRDFKLLDDRERHVFLANLQYQILLDSVQGRGPNIAFLPVASLPEVENWITTWSFIETIHSRSYTHIIRSIMSHPETVFDTILDDPKIIMRAKTITGYYDKCIFMTQCLQAVGPGIYVYEDQELTVDLSSCKKQLFLTLNAVNALEAIRFYVSFACNFSFAENNKLEGAAKIMRLIARDEALHHTSTQYMINTMLSGGDGDLEMMDIARGCQAEMLFIFMEVVQQEKEWAQYLFRDGPTLNLNTEALCSYIDYLATQHMHAIGLEYPLKVTKNPLPWIEHYLKSDNVQAAPQEVALTAYKTGGGIDFNFTSNALTDSTLE
jgi:ribonucleoside-diphosphate reductase beta chain